jgi:N-acetylglutamate synthase-like GNAT family acetyltransferase
MSMSPQLEPEQFCSKRGRPLAIRLADAGDAPALAALLGGLSARSVERRYLTPRVLDEAAARREAARLSGAGAGRIVIIAEAEDAAIVAVAELARDDAEPAVAESAVVVADAYQGEGIGRAVLARLAAAATGAAISRLRAVTQAHNLPVRRLIASSGRPYTARFVGPEVLYEVAL